MEEKSFFKSIKIFQFSLSRQRKMFGETSRIFATDSFLSRKFFLEPAVTSIGAFGEAYFCVCFRFQKLLQSNSNSRGPLDEVQFG